MPINNTKNKYSKNLSAPISEAETEKIKLKQGKD